MVVVIKMKILFVCIANVNRSPTFEKWVNCNTRHICKSAGTHPYKKENKVTKELI
jgi:protein-tyrosine-phosphatase